MDWFRSRLERWYGRLLRLYPEEFRADYGAEMQADVAGRGATEPLGGLVRDLLVDFFLTAPREHYTMLMQDLKFAFRTLAQSPAFVVTALLSLAVGIGANAAMFSVADALLLRPMPVREASRVFWLVPHHPVRSTNQLAYSDYRDVREQAKSLEETAALSVGTFSVRTAPDAVPKLLVGAVASANLFEFAGATPVLGRGFRPEEERVGQPPVVVLGYDLWRDQYGRDPNVLGKTLRVNTAEFTIVGVAPESFQGLQRVVHNMVWVPVGTAPLLLPQGAAVLEDRELRQFQVLARLRPEADRDQAEAELAALARGWQAAYPKSNEQLTYRLRTEIQRRKQESPPDVAVVTMLMALAVAVWLIACANVANLQMVRARARMREVAVRLAVGASRARLVRQMLTESLVVALAGGVLGLGVGYGGVWFFRQIPIPSDIPIDFDLRMDERVLALTAAASLFSAVLFGLTPALRASRHDLVTALKESDAARRERFAGRNVLVVAQVALSVILMVAGTMLVDGFRRLLRTDPGFDTRQAVMLGLDPTVMGYPEEKTREFQKRLLESARQMPGVRSAALARAIPFDQNPYFIDFVPEGFQLARDEQSVFTFGNVVSADYFETLNLVMARGRGIRSTDTATAPKVAVINEELARRYFPNQDPVGRRLRVVQSGEWHEIVGVARQSKYLFPTEAPFPYLYLASSQVYSPRMTLLVSAQGDPAELAGPVREMVRRLDPHQPVFAVRTMRDYFHQRAVVTSLRIVQVVAAMGLVGLGLALTGLYGVVSYAVSRRTREIGIRMAIGASHAGVMGMMLRQGLLLTGLGLALGLAVALPMSGFISSALFGLGVANPPTLALMLVLLVAATGLASFIPARRAALVNPVSTLRHE